MTTTKGDDDGSSKTRSLSWKTRATLAGLSFITDSSRRRDGTVNRRLLGLFDFRSPTRSSGPVTSADHTVDASRNLWMRIYTPSAAGESPLPVVLFFHGGGFVFLTPDSFVYDSVCRSIAATIPAVVASVNYRLAPEHKYPSQYDDGFEALKFLHRHFSDLSPPVANLSRWFVGGDSAGANLAHHVAVRACRERDRGTLAGDIVVVGVIAIQPFYGGEERTPAEERLTRAPVVSVERTDWMWRAFLPEGADRDHEAANVSGPHAEDLSELGRFPKTVVVVGGLDPLQDWQRKYYRWLVAAGKEAELIEYRDSFHAFYIFPELPESRRLFGQIKEFVHSC